MMDRRPPPPPSTAPPPSSFRNGQNQSLPVISRHRPPSLTSLSTRQPPPPRQPPPGYGESERNRPEREDRYNDVPSSRDNYGSLSRESFYSDFRDLRRNNDRYESRRYDLSHRTETAPSSHSNLQPLFPSSSQRFEHSLNSRSTSFEGRSSYNRDDGGRSYDYHRSSSFESGGSGSGRFHDRDRYDSQRSFDRDRPDGITSRAYEGSSSRPREGSTPRSSSYDANPSKFERSYPSFEPLVPQLLRHHSDDKHDRQLSGTHDNSMQQQRSSSSQRPYPSQSNSNAPRSRPFQPAPPPGPPPMFRRLSSNESQSSSTSQSALQRSSSGGIHRSGSEGSFVKDGEDSYHSRRRDDEYSSRRKKDYDDSYYRSSDYTDSHKDNDTKIFSSQRFKEQMPPLNRSISSSTPASSQQQSTPLSSSNVDVEEGEVVQPSISPALVIPKTTINEPQQSIPQNNGGLKPKPSPPPYPPKRRHQQSQSLSRQDDEEELEEGEIAEPKSSIVKHPTPPPPPAGPPRSSSSSTVPSGTGIETKQYKSEQIESNQIPKLVNVPFNKTSAQEEGAVVNGNNSDSKTNMDSSNNNNNHLNDEEEGHLSKGE